IIIDNTFFDRPEDLPFIQNLKNIFKNWLVIYGISDNSSNSIANRLPSYFLYALIEEWRDNSDKYEILLRAQESPWAEAEKRDWEWREYNKFLEKQVEKSIFNEPYSLSQLYISLNAYYVDKSDRFSVDAEATSEREKVRRVVILEDELLTWVNQNNQEDAIRIISGGPGSGKSSFLKIFAAKLANQDKCKVLYVPLHLIDPTNKLIDEIESFVKDEHILSENPLNPDSPEKSLLLIFDGLDELSSQGKAAVKAVTDFIDQVEKVVERINNNELTLKVIISGRELVVQENENVLKRQGKILTLLPFFMPKNEIEKHKYKDPSGLLKEDLRGKWWGKYGDLTGKGFKNLPKELVREDLEETTSQPLLNYLVAIAYTLDDKKNVFDFSGDFNINKVYYFLLKAVHQKAYDTHQFVHTKHMHIDDFIEVLEEVGLSSWHGGMVVKQQKQKL
ncbi:NACHT domain-containing protein, partial [bacterium]|nr:NACHT domain-containing protein [bacterium]